MVYALAGFIEHHFGKDLILTSVFRDQAHSVHKYWRGVDFRICPKGGEPIYTKKEIESIKAFCNHFNYGKARLKSLKVHDAGTGLHGHLQVNAFGVTEIL
jgi:hypothetical protein